EFDIDVDGCRSSASNTKPIRSGRRSTIEQCMDHELARAPGRGFDPERAEEREFLSSRLTGVYCQAARGKSVNLRLRYSAKIARTLEYGDLIEHVGAVDRPVDPKTRKAHYLAFGWRPGKRSDVARRKEDTGIALRDQIERTQRERARDGKAYPSRMHDASFLDR